MAIKANALPGVWQICVRKKHAPKQNGSEVLKVHRGFEEVPFLGGCVRFVDFKLTYSTNISKISMKGVVSKTFRQPLREVCIGSTPRAPGCNRHHQEYAPFLGSGIPT